MENAASVGRGHSARTLGVPTAPFPWGHVAQGVAKLGLCLQLSVFFGMLFPVAPLDLPQTPVPCSVLAARQLGPSAESNNT